MSKEQSSTCQWWGAADITFYIVADVWHSVFRIGVTPARVSGLWLPREAESATAIPYAQALALCEQAAVKNFEGQRVTLELALRVRLNGNSRHDRTAQGPARVQGELS